MSWFLLIAKSELRSLIQVFTEPVHQHTLKLYARRLEIYTPLDAGYRVPTELQRVGASISNPSGLPHRSKEKKKEKKC